MAGIDGCRHRGVETSEGAAVGAAPRLARRCGRVGQAGEELGEDRVVFVAASHVATVWELRMLILLSYCSSGFEVAR
jgi:hypothetical protein